MKRGDITFCVDVALLAAPLIVGTAIYGTLFAAELGVKSLRTLIWGKK